MKKYQIGTLFPNINTTIAHYSPTAFCITLNTITQHQLSQINPSKEDNADNRSILYHEMRHNIDHLSTLWGQSKILQLSEAVNAKLGRDEKQFHKMITYKIGENQLHFDKYFTETYNAVTHTPARTPGDLISQQAFVLIVRERYWKIGQ
ncbi:hypothetical protein [Pedobacter roseus]|uniref:Uncharacterized protein n=1 Tax=Pedobacter roseus TaxID=336820 RepID=A0A7G9QH02_9SPHI|nr:hypothetical protein [Pedobacter roseus]QNN42627.1 hypothetical protein H9L23_00465 [Pedobacter roseus]